MSNNEHLHHYNSWLELASEASEEELVEWVNRLDSIVHPIRRHRKAAAALSDSRLSAAAEAVLARLSKEATSK